MAEGTTATAQDRLAIALDVDDLVVALRLGRELRPFFRTAKIGLELYSSVGPDAVTSLTDLGFDVFCDLKFHDIATTVNKSSRVIGALGAKYLNLHGQGGVTMLRAGVEGLKQGAADAGLPEPLALAVTVLTSDVEAPPHILGKRVQAALESDCDGIVCAASDVREAKQYGPRLFAAVPGIRPAGSPRHEQARAATPREALDAGADLIILGRAVTAAEAPTAAAAAVATELGGTAD